MAKNLLGKFIGKCCDSNIMNNNDMTLGRKLFENVINSQEYKDAIERGHYIGFLGHPEDPGCQEFKDACIVMTSMTLEDNGEITGEFNLVNTPVGRVVKAFIDAGVKFGISIRGCGDVAADGDVDPETFVFRGFDLVAFPAYNDCVPEFQAIAASSDVAAKKVYSKVCAAIKENLPSITSCEALNIIQDQFNPDSATFAVIEERKSELANSESKCDENCSVAEQKIAGLTDLYLAEVAKNAKLNDEINQLKEAVLNADSDIHETTILLSRQLKAAKRILGEQLEKANNNAVTAAAQAKKYQRISAINASKVAEMHGYAADLAKKNKILASANSNLKSNLDKASKTNESLNLKYKQKITSAQATIADNKSEISKLDAKLRETVTASTNSEVKIADLTSQINLLRKDIEAADNLILQYQEAYANIYANALGVRVDSLPISASTSVADLQAMIQGATNTANIPHVPAIIDDDIDDVFYSDDALDADMITM